ncbi:MAG: hypothetical protein JSR82_20105 [Verrucomicrobia bacterium]|nr:hypothetical protein [Verrucomicrobiota bacterium]
MPHVFTRPDGSEQKVSGYQFRAPLASAKRYAASSRVQKLPAKVDLRPHLSPVENQGALSSCVANAVAGAYEYLVRRHKEDSDYDVSRLFIYYNARAKQGDVEEDGGSIIADAIQSLREEGACSEATWPYEEDSVNEEPSQEAYDEASEFLVEDMQLVPCHLESWKTALAEGYPIIFGIGLYDSFDKQRKRGLVPMPSPKEASRASHSGHAMLCVGYSDPDQVFIVRNSWGEDWGDDGYCYIPYNYLINPRHNDGDSWIIRQLENLDMDAGTWGDEESLIGDLQGELADMSDEDYQDMLDAMGELYLETRLAMLFLTCAGADGDISDEELEGIAKYVGVLLEQMNSDYEPEKVLRYALKKLDERRVQESIELFAEHVPQTMLASILRSMREIVGVDEVSQDEEEFLDALVTAWQVEDLNRGAEGEDEAAEDDDQAEDDDNAKDDEEDEEGADNRRKKRR